MQAAFDERQDFEAAHEANTNKMTNANSVYGQFNTSLANKKEQVKAAAAQLAAAKLAGNAGANPALSIRGMMTNNARVRHFVV